MSDEANLAQYDSLMTMMARANQPEGWLQGLQVQRWDLSFIESIIFVLELLLSIIFPAATHAEKEPGSSVPLATLR